MKWISTAALLMALGCGLSASRAMAQQGMDATASDDVRARFEQQEQQIRALQDQLAAMQQQQQQPVATPAGYANADAVVAAAAKPTDPPKPYEVGSDLSGIVFFSHGEFLNFSTPNKDFTMHLGGWVQWDSVWWNEPVALQAFQTPAAGNRGLAIASANAGGGLSKGSAAVPIDLQDGEYWRRLRIVQEGTFWETGEYRFNWALENIQFDSCGLDEVWVGQNSIPVIGTIRAGHVKNAIGLEGDMTSSSRCMTFMERSAYSEAIELNQNFVTGLWFGNSWADDRMTYQAVFARPDADRITGDFFGDDQMVAQGRLTCLPIWTDNGRQFLHLGVSAGFRNGQDNLSSTSYIGNTTTLAAHPQLKDDDPAGAFGPNTDGNAMISTGALACNNEWLMGLEMAYVRGPFSVQAEYGWNWCNDASGILSTSTPTAPKLAPTSDYCFSGGYLMFTYTLTGENRGYDKKSGCFSRYYFGTEGPYENAYFTRDDANGGLCFGRGAWELACRLDYVQLNSSGPAAATLVNGGTMDGVAVGLNWYWNTNMTLNFEWQWDNRYNNPADTVAGAVNGFGTRMQYSF